eukprot:2469413-Alexandrium_andersonii.AAC.1
MQHAHQVVGCCVLQRKGPIWKAKRQSRIGQLPNRHNGQGLPERRHANQKDGILWRLKLYQALLFQVDKALGEVRIALRVHTHTGAAERACLDQQRHCLP